MGVSDVTFEKVDLPQEIDEAAREASPTRVSAGAIVSTARPRQWAKNVLVFGAPATGGVLTDPAALASIIAAFIAFCLVASGVYFFNDIADASTDRLHPTKRFRSIAAGQMSRSLAAALGALLVAVGLAVAVWGGGLGLLGVLAGYVGLSVAYMLVLRDIALIDLAAISGGFLLRAVAGGVATDVPLSMFGKWKISFMTDG